MSEKTPVTNNAPNKGQSNVGSWSLSFVLAVLMHVGLFFGLFVVFQWNTQSEDVVYAELWNAAPAPAQPQPKIEAPKPVEPDPQPEPEPQPEPPTPPKVEEPAPVPEDVIRQQDEEARKKKELEEKKKLEEQKRLEEEKRKREEQKRLEEEKRKKREQERIRKEKEKKRKEMARQLAQQMQQDEMKRIEETSKDNAAGRMAGDLGNSQTALYNSRVVACVRKNLIFNVAPDMQPGQYKTEYEVELMPDGKQVGAPKLIRGSSLPSFDKAVETAIRACDPFPTNPAGNTPKTIRLSFDPVESRQ